MSATATDPNLQHLTKAREQISQGDLKNAALTLNKANRQWPQDPRVFMLGALLAEKSGNVQGAFDALRKSVALAPDWGPGLLELALLLARQNQFKEAVETAEKVAALEPKNLQVLAGVIDIAHRAGHTEMAIRHLRRGLELVPGDLSLSRLLARDLSNQGEHAASVALWTELVAAHPGDTSVHMGRIRACIAAGEPAQAQANAEALLAIAPDDPVARYYDQCTRGETPQRQPVALVQELFDGMASLYDQHVVRGLRYQLPKQVAEQLLAHYPDRNINVLDLGCGTGLLGVSLGPLQGHLIGVDVSRPMIEQAARHNLYSRFHTVDMHDALRETPEGLYQVVAALDLFSYAGSLTEAIPHALRLLAPGGTFVVSCEPAAEDGADMVLQTNGRYAHKLSHVKVQCQAAGFASVDVQDTVLWYENNEPVHGFVVTARKAT
ncbi:tetratricopeptide repeat protein [Paracidovorax sp. MALMAid1276]|uniref:tetratricopeptide repeat protein n=1 Tax=Paracidovorax sp. MALMAid1276 TaxID=3411631 RepID=UPI003B993125